MKETNPPATPAAKISEGLDFSAPDRVDDTMFNKILWSMMKGGQPIPAVEGKVSLHAYWVAR
jgi:hypothetical protein